MLKNFAEIFESFEYTVRREVREETGVFVDPVSLRHHSSQPWPSAEGELVERIEGICARG